MTETLGKYMVSERDLTHNGKTGRWTIRNKRSGGALGTIRWYGAWHQYTFFPAPDCVFNRACLLDIIDFIDAQMNARLAAKQQEVAPDGD